MLRTLEWLREQPLEYEDGHSIIAIDRAISCGLAKISEPYKVFSGKPPRWRIVRKVEVAE